MKIKVNKNILMKELAIAGKYRGKEGKGQGGESFIALIATEEGLTVRATDGQVFYSNILPLQVVGEEDLETVHEVYVPGKVALTSKFEESFRKFPSKEVSIEVENDVIKIEADDVDAKIPTVPCDIKELPVGTEGDSIEGPKSFFETIRNKTAFASGIFDSRPILKGINLKGNGKEFLAIATDSHRLARYVQEEKIEFKEITVPAKQFSSVLEAFDDGEKIKLVALENYVKLEQDEKEVYIRLLDGDFPDTSRLVNLEKDSLTHIKVNSKQLLDAIDRALPFAKDEKGNLLVQLEIKADGIRVSSNSNEGSIESLVSILEKKGEYLDKVTLNAKYTTDAIRSHDSKEITFIIEQKLMPTYFLSEDTGNIQLIVPVRTK